MLAGSHRAACVFNIRSSASTWEQRAPEGPIYRRQAGTHMRYCSHHCHGIMAWHLGAGPLTPPVMKKGRRRQKQRFGEDSVSRRLIPLMFQVLQRGSVGRIMETEALETDRVAGGQRSRCLLHWTRVTLTAHSSALPAWRSWIEVSGHNDHESISSMCWFCPPHWAASPVCTTGVCAGACSCLLTSKPAA